MSRLEDIEAGFLARGLSPEGLAKVVGGERFGGQDSPSAIKVVYEEDGGALGSRILYRSEEASVEIVAGGPGSTASSGRRTFSFDGDEALLRLVSEAMRIRLAHLFDPYLAVHTSRIEPLPHQITAVYGEMLSRHPLRFLLADDPGAGKTIMTGLLIKEMVIRGDLERCLIVVPGNLTEQWQDELLSRFNLPFSILGREHFAASSGNPFDTHPHLIARLDMLSRNKDLQEVLRGAAEYDLIVVDEAHKMSASFTGGEVRYTGRYHLGETLRERARHFLLLSATLHSGKQEDFELFMALLDEDRFEGRPGGSARTSANDLMRRLVKEELYTFEGKPLFPERRAYTVGYDLSPDEASLYDEVTTYVREEMNRAERFASENKEEKRRALNVGFALTILQRRLASSPEAIYKSLGRRRERLSDRLEERFSGTAARNPLGSASGYALDDPEDVEDFEDAPEGEIEQEEQRLLDQATASATVGELRTEIETLKGLEQKARQVLRSGNDAKWTQLSTILDDPLMTNENGERRKLIIFTEARDTLSYLAGRIRTLRGREEEVEIHGGVSREQRKAAVEAFVHDPEVIFLVANDVACRGREPSKGALDGQLRPAVEPQPPRAALRSHPSHRAG